AQSEIPMRSSKTPLFPAATLALLVCLQVAALDSPAVQASAPSDGQKNADSPKSAEGQKNAMSVSVTTPQTAPLVRTLVATGTVFAWQEAVIGPEVGGYRVAAVNVDVGDKVKRGQELVRLSDELLVADVSSKRAAKLQAEAQLVTASSDRRRGDLVKDSGALSSSELEKLHNDELA